MAMMMRKRNGINRLEPLLQYGQKQDWNEIAMAARCVLGRPRGVSIADSHCDQIKLIAATYLHCAYAHFLEQRILLDWEHIAHIHATKCRIILSYSLLLFFSFKSILLQQEFLINMWNLWYTYIQIYCMFDHYHSKSSVISVHDYTENILSSLHSNTFIRPTHRHHHQCRRIHLMLLNFSLCVFGSWTRGYANVLRSSIYILGLEATYNRA